MPNNADDYIKFANELHASATELFTEANQEYAGDKWTMNFDFVTIMMRIAGHADFIPRNAALTYLMKSIFSIAKAKSTRQSMRSRYQDAINYLTFMAWMDEHKHDTTLTTSSVNHDNISNTDIDHDNNFIYQKVNTCLTDSLTYYVEPTRVFNTDCDVCYDVIPSGVRFYHRIYDDKRMCKTCLNELSDSFMD